MAKPPKSPPASDIESAKQDEVRHVDDATPPAKTSAISNGHARRVSEGPNRIAMSGIRTIAAGSGSGGGENP